MNLSNMRHPAPNRSPSLRWGLVTVILAAGCHGPSSSSSSSSSPAAAPALPRAGAAPLVVEWVPGPRSATRLELTARLEFRAVFDQPVQVQVTVPAGVRLVEGAERFSLPAPPRPGTIDRPYVFALGGAARGEIVLEADVRGEGFGMHARRAYALDTAVRAPGAPEAATSSKRGPDLEVGGRNFGPPIPLDR